MTDGTLTAADGTRLACHRGRGAGEPLVCLPGGPMAASDYLGDLGGLDSVVRLDLRGTGDSAEPADPSTYRLDRQVADVEALRMHLGLEQFDLLGHSAGGSLAVRYAEQHPSRIRRLVLVTPSPFVVGLEISDADRRAVAELRRSEPWFSDAYAAFERIWAGAPTAADWAAIEPFRHGRAGVPADEPRRNAEAAGRYYADDALDPDATRAAIAQLAAPVLLIAGEFDVSLPPARAEEYRKLFPHGELAVAPASGHYPWADDPAWFVRTVTAFRTGPARPAAGWRAEPR
jgi:proline iminopeptidase